MIAKELETTLHHAFLDAREQRHQYIGIEQLLVALLENPSAAEVLRKCQADTDKLRADLQAYIAQQTRVGADRTVDTQPTLGFQRVIQRAILHQQSSGKSEVTGADVLIAIFGEKDSRAVDFLQRHGIVRLDVLSARVERVSPRGPAREAAIPEGAELQVVLYNDDFTPMEFVVKVLQKFFSMSREDATETMLEIHREGVAVCGLYARDAALGLMTDVLEHAREHGHPLHCGVVAPPKVDFQKD